MIYTVYLHAVQLSIVLCNSSSSPLHLPFLVSEWCIAPVSGLHSSGVPAGRRSQLICCSAALQQAPWAHLEISGIAMNDRRAFTLGPLVAHGALQPGTDRLSCSVGGVEYFAGAPGGVGCTCRRAVCVLKSVSQVKTYGKHEHFGQLPGVSLMRHAPSSHGSRQPGGVVLVFCQLSLSTHRAATSCQRVRLLTYAF